jgi:hypothetical protein
MKWDWEECRDIILFNLEFRRIKIPCKQISLGHFSSFGWTWEISSYSFSTCTLTNLIIFGGKKIERQVAQIL